jgi:hypothetical protein
MWTASRCGGAILLPDGSQLTGDRHAGPERSIASGGSPVDGTQRLVNAHERIGATPRVADPTGGD